ncbi:MAG: NAD(P)-dependent oxidoreductase, partial [Acidimicrobiia bacterium]|nr:NAD(P)-dependent oxidoreductase [Acidimicrobiia bacterium]
MARIIISEFISDAGLDVLRGHDVVYDESLADDPDRLRVLVAGAEGLIVRNRTRVPADLVEGSPPLRVVGRLGVGLDNIDVEACRRRDVEVCAAFGANAESVAEYVITAVLLLIRGVFMVTDDVIVGQWPRTSLRGLEVRGRTLGLVGLGDIGRRIALRAGSLGLEVIAHDPYVSPADEAWQLAQRVSLHDLFTRADAVSVNVPLTEETVGLVGPEVL